MESKIPNNSEPTQDYVLLTLLSVFFGALGITLLYLVLKIWPAGITNAPQKVYIFGNGWWLSPEHRYLLLMTLGGALGASVHLLISFSAFVGNRAFVTSWVPWYMLRPIIGAAMALFFYMLLRGGILTYGSSTTPTEPPQKPANSAVEVTSPKAPTPAQPDTGATNVQGPTVAAADTTANDTSGSNTAGSAAAPATSTAAGGQQTTAPVPPLNPFGMMAIACMVGLFSKEASKKLEELFKTLFNVREEQQVPYKDKLPTDKRVQDPASTVAATPDTATDKGSTEPADDINDVLPDADDDDATADPDHKDAEPQG